MGRIKPLRITEMGYALIWAQSLAAVLLLMAIITAFSARWSRRIMQRGLPVLCGFLLYLFAGAVFYTAWDLKSHGGLARGMFFYAISWPIAFSLGTMAVLHFG